MAHVPTLTAFLSPFGRSEIRQLPKHPDSQAMGIRMFWSINQKYFEFHLWIFVPLEKLLSEETHSKVSIHFPVKTAPFSFFRKFCPSQSLSQVRQYNDVQRFLQ